MTLQEYRRLTPDSRSELIFQELQSLRAQVSVCHEEISHFRELENDRKKIRKRRAKAAKLAKVGSV